MRYRFCYAALCAAFLHQCQPADADERRIALVVTNSAYAPALPQLTNAHEDGLVMSAALRAVGFEVREARDADQTNLREEILGFVRSLREDSTNTVSFFYFSGHGAADRDMQGENFLIPVRSQVASADELRARGVSLQEVIKSIEAAQVKASFVVLDACRNVPFPAGAKSLQKGLVPERRSGGMLIAYATTPGEVAQDNNVYAKVLADALQRPTIDAFTVFKDVQIEVARRSSRQQVPWTEDGLLAKIFFKDGAPAAKPSSPPAPSAAAAENRPPLPGFPVQTPPSVRVASVPLDPGGGVMTGFSGVAKSGDGGRPVINGDAPVVRIFDLMSVKALTANQKTNTPLVQAKAIGQVYGIAIEAGNPGSGPPKIYVAATSAYGLPVVARVGAEETLNALSRGAPGAEWAPGLFGTSKEGGPGSVWKIDGATGELTLFADIRLDGVHNSGPGLGQLAFDPRTRQLFVSDLDTGMIHRLSMKGAELGYWDHGVQGRPARKLAAVSDDKRRANITSGAFDPTNPGTWGFTDIRRKVWGIVVRTDRLYYAVSEGPQIWSVGLKVDGAFAGDARFEFEVPGLSDDAEIPQIRFDRDGNMYVAVLGGSTVQHDHGKNGRRNYGRILRFKRQPGSPDANPRWEKEYQQLPVGNSNSAQAALLDLAYGLGDTGDIDKSNCRGTLWTSGLKAQPDQKSLDQQFMLAWRIGSPDDRSVSIADLDSDRTFPVPGSLAMLAPCDRGEDSFGIAGYHGPPLEVRPPTWDTPLSEPDAGHPPASGHPSAPGGTSPATPPSTSPPTSPPQSAETQSGVSSPGFAAISLPCARVAAQQFQCIAGAWELEISMDDEARRGLDALTVNPLVTNASVFPSVQRRSRPSDPFRIRFDDVPSGNQVPLDVCLHDGTISQRNVAFRCCRAQVVVHLPQVPCGPPSQVSTAVSKPPSK
jgi:hypothetical protein